jgi:hypothetical protein
MDLALLVYGISLLESFGKLIGFITALCGMAVIGSGIHQLSWRFDTYEYSWNCNKDGTLKASVLANRALTTKVFKWSLIATIILSFLCVLIPSQKTAYTMVGAYVAQKVSENEKVQDTGGKVMTIINQKLDHYIEEGIKEATDEVKSRRNKSKD